MIDKFKPQPDVREADSKCRLSLNIDYRRIDELKPDPANPRAGIPSSKSERSPTASGRSASTFRF
jgi:hypothetical protein